MTSNKWQPPKISVFTPFLRRFTDERALDISETRELYRKVNARHQESVWSRPYSIDSAANVILRGLAYEVPSDLKQNARDLVRSLLELETTVFKSADDPDVGALSLKELVDLRRFLRAQEHFLDHAEEGIDLYIAYIQGIIECTIKELPKLDSPSPFTVPLINLVSIPGMMVEKIVGSISIDRLVELGFFAEVGATVDDNINQAYKIDTRSPPKRKLPSIVEKTEEEGWGPVRSPTRF